MHLDSAISPAGAQRVRVGAGRSEIGAFCPRACPSGIMNLKRMKGQRSSGVAVHSVADAG